MAYIHRREHKPRYYLIKARYGRTQLIARP